VVGHQAVCDYCSTVLPIVALDQAKTIFVVAGIEEYQRFSQPPDCRCDNSDPERTRRLDMAFKTPFSTLPQVLNLREG